MNSHPPVLACEQLSKTYIDGQLRVEVLHKLDLTVFAHDTIAIVGTSGAGKSTLLHLLGGLEKPSSGRVLINGQNLNEQFSEKERSALRNRYLGFVYQFHHLLPEFTALENVCMPLLIGNVNREEAIDRAINLIHLVGLSHRYQHKPSELSGGEKQRLAIVRALITNPVCLLADEPTGNLDERTKEQVFETLLMLNETIKTSMVIVTHDRKLASRLKRTLVLENGRLSE